MRTFTISIVPALITIIAACDHGSVREDDGETRVTQSRLEPALEPGDPTCADLGYAMSIDDYPVNVGTFSRGSVSVTVSNMTSVFDWSTTSSSGIDAVIVQGGPDANVYRYDTPAMGDTALHPPVNIPQNQGKYYGFHRIQFCFHIVDQSADAGASDSGGNHDRTW